MSKSAATRECDIFTRARNNGVKTTSARVPSEVEANQMDSLAEVLNELKSLQSEIGTKLDNIDTRLTGVAGSLTALESKVSQVKQDVSLNATRIEEAEGRIQAAENALEKTEAVLDLAVKRIAYLESKTDDLENRGRRKNLRLYGIREGAEGQKALLEFISDMLPQWLGLSPDKSFTLERVHRTLATRKPNQNRAILIRFLKFQEREFVYRESRRRGIVHDGVKISFAQDLSAKTVRIRREFNPVTKLLDIFLDINAFCGFQHNPCKLRVVHSGKMHLFATPQEAEKFYKSILQIT